jgi:hypothetical protein
MGKTGSEKSIAETVPYDESFKELHKQMQAGEASGADLAKKMADAHKGQP